ncbi:ABC transporter substrate-binding protein [Paenibacillus mucilaginosus]|uniref:ABC transporter substrate-binding protein n=2 Tax=Paenibacillus mucilaginosus TaxID=61624 RepID=I0BAR1_9BACL|nr:ABC transporter substrate-binding protein [Paenibacillus mucilaginosus]AEI39012.1 extracellular solute-binding protein family 1 [Paenibacillus mucilaginosus KNP414]AFH59458.1 ABC transporter substrate-binding protein [Paenibacillus mucilaginosus K02]MCG7216148.1 ABC transporter substrate-binding protein [Paenibacillus mucilaginosus]WDM28052.1 ABC transporter substrate-binding protein [Paenibacillus mucilaginosus]
MMRRSTKWVSVMLAAALVTVTGCSKEPAAEPGQASGSGTDPITMSVFSADPNPAWNNMQDEVGKKLTEKTGVTLKMEFPVGSSDQKIPLMVSSGEYPDMILPKGDPGKLVAADALLDLTDLIEQHGPNLKKVYGKYMKRLRWSTEDPSIYILPISPVDQEYFDAGGGFELQHAVVKELGYPKIRTVKDFENAIKAYKDKYPTIDGKPTIGLSLNADDWHIMISVTNPAFLTTGAPDDGEYYIDPKTYEAKFHYFRPEEKEYFRWLNHMNNIGLIDPESFVQKYDQYKAKIASGRVLGLIDQDWDYQEAQNVLRKEGKFERTYGHYPVTLNESFKDHSFQDTGYLAGYGIGITKSAKDPVRAIKFLDYLASDEGQVLINWGIEGVHYKVENGMRVIPPDVLDKKVNDANNFAKTSGIGQYYISARYGDGVKDPTGSTYTTTTVEQKIASYSEADKETLKAYGATTWKDLFPKKEEFPVKPWGAAWSIPVEPDSNVNVTYNKAKTIVWKRIPEAILAKPEQFDAIYDGMLQELDKVGVKKMEQEYTELVKERVKLFNE